MSPLKKKSGLLSKFSHSPVYRKLQCYPTARKIGSMLNTCQRFFGSLYKGLPIRFYISIMMDPRICTKNIVSINTDRFIQPDDEDVKLAKIICESYNYMVKKSKTIEKPYKTGEFWDVIINEKRDFYAPIKKGDISSASVVLANFFKTSAIGGLWEGGDYTSLMKSFKAKLLFINATLRTYDFWRVLTNESLDIINIPDGGHPFANKRVLTNESLDIVNLPNVGNPFGYKIDRNIVSTAQFKLHYHSQQTYNLIRDVGVKPVVAEIGGGFGGIAYYLFKIGFNGTYLGFDIPETLILEEYFLLKTFPDKKILIYNGQECVTLDDINNYDIILMPNFMLKKIPDLCVDIVVNTRSFSEMPIETIEEYMLQINRICRKYIYHDNSNYKSHRNEIPAYEFPIPSCFRLLTKVKSLWYDGLTAQNRFVEYLYERKP